MKIMIIVLASLLANLFSCSSNPTEPSGNYGTIVISFEGTSSTEAWVNLKTQNISFPAEINLLLDSKKLTNINLTSNDTTIYIDSLLPNRSYQLEAQFTANNLAANSNKLIVQTLDTTSHNFTWQTYTFGGQAGSCVLRDVAIINQNDIWAVGEIYMNDSTGQPDPKVYNAVHWDGSKWELKRITTEFRGNLITVPLEGIFAFSSLDIWTVGSLPIHGDGTNWTMYDVRTTTDANLALSKAWGSNSNDMYFVGRNGSIAHYLNGYWSKIQSGTSLNIQDIWGGVNPYTGETEVLCIASNIFATTEPSWLIQIKPTFNNWLNVGTLPATMSSVWFMPGIKYYLAGDGTFTFHSFNGKHNDETNRIPSYYRFSIRGNEVNDVVICGSFGLISHYNGKSWHTYSGDELQYFNGNYYKIEIKDNIIATVGQSGAQAIITIGKR
ncbi:MAG TPA: hypothetical protein VJ954_05090 [Ignavibacteriaceae bacterium]|nr:hypothetical protein [Ignavibacteriaceae bacterium]